MKILQMIAATCLYAAALHAQPANPVPGVYSLHGVMETASGFKLNEDSTFEFYYSYGALDRYGSGKWSIKNNTILLNSKPYPGKDFKLVGQALDNKKVSTVKIADKNPVFFQFVNVLLHTNNGDTLVPANNKGVIALPVKTDTIRLVFELTPERISTFAVNNKKANVYTFQFEPWIVEVFFKDFALRYEQGLLVGRHPLLEDKEYSYEKESDK